MTNHEISAVVALTSAVVSLGWLLSLVRTIVRKEKTMQTITEFDRLGDGKRPESVGFRMKNFFSFGPNAQARHIAAMEIHIKTKCRALPGIASFDVTRNRFGNDLTWFVTFSWRKDVDKFEQCQPGYFDYHSPDIGRIFPGDKLRIIRRRQTANTFRLLYS